jgi:hypothetical protein
MTDPAPNPFDAFAEAVKPSWAKSRERAQAKAAETRAKSKAEKTLDENEMLERLWVAGERQRRRDLLAGQFGVEIKALMAFLKSMTLDSAPDLIATVESAAWMKAMSNNDKIQVLDMIGQRIDRIHRDEGLDPPDDALWDEEPRARQVIKDMMEVR